MGPLPRYLGFYNEEALWKDDLRVGNHPKNVPR